jgi:hypothetical protein
MTTWEWVTLGLMVVSSIITYLVSFVSLRQKLLDHLGEEDKRHHQYTQSVRELKDDIRELRNLIMRRTVA